MDVDTATKENKGLSAPNVRQRTYTELKEMILSGELRPGDRLSEARLSKGLGVSRTPLREALMRLDEEGLVVGRANAGYTVVDLDVKTVCDFLVVREALDACAAELACQMATEDDFEELRSIVAEMESLHSSNAQKPTNSGREFELGVRIHEVIARAARNEALIKMTNQIYQRLRLALWLEVLLVDWEDVGLEEHRAIADAIISRDTVRAASAARKHVRTSIENMSKVDEIYRSRRGRALR